MTSIRPFLLRAFYDWMLSNGFTPYVIVDARPQEGLHIPIEHVENDKIVFNLGPKAVKGLKIDDRELYFSARFSGRAETVVAPISAILAVYAKENYAGIVFSQMESTIIDEAVHKLTPAETPKKQKPILRVVK